MNQTKKRLQIINIAISLTDIETIQLQILKLSALRSDPKLQEIISGLQAQNYAQTQALITTYIETPMEEIVQRTPQNDEEIIDKFDLFVTTPEEPKKEETELFDFDTLVKEPNNNSTKESTEEAFWEAPESVQTQQDDTFDDLLNLTADDVMPGNIELDISHTPHDDFFDTPDEDSPMTKESHIDTNFIPKDDFFDTVDGLDTATSLDTEKNGGFANLSETDREEIHEETGIVKEETLFETVGKETRCAVPEAAPVPLDKSKAESMVNEHETLTGAVYKPIPYIDQKLKNMLTQYPSLHESSERYVSVDNWLLKISNRGYTEKEIEEIISHILKLKESNGIAEAAQLLLISAATESKFAQFMLARELFKGELLEKNLPEAFTLINRLALDDYPEAICDLAQFYENGIGIGKDRKKAEELYREAMEQGVKRAALHYERVQKANRGLLGKFFGKK
ncbi:tetratricopeptide repeat protein [Sulfurovum lithotrophicum]|uniref:tetratricopeptide repeat protein n=1 Tax=Sulfurovum lithotrophicum TaxID=206403 RepID=UPI00069752C6|nr:tetratricopeptide repeat protein [Sulfurovum lithotrophicum]